MIYNILTVSHTGIHCYHHKSTGYKVDVESCRKEWSEGRNITWYLPNQRPIKLRDQLRECEELFSSQRIICVKWKTLRHFIILLQSGVMILFTVSKQSGDIEGILIDRTLLQRIDAPLDRAIVLDGVIIFLYTDNNKVGVVCTMHGKRVSTTASLPTPLTLSQENTRRRIEKMACLDLKMSTLVVKGMPAGQVDRHVIANSQRDLVAIWWKDKQDGGLQWSSMADGECNNVTIIRKKSNGKLELVTKLQTQSDPVSIFFSKCHANLMYSVTQSTNTCELNMFDCSGDKRHKHTVESTISTDSDVTICSMNKDENLLLLGCDNGTVILYDIKKDVIKKSMAYFSHISSICWHPAGGLVFVSSLRGEVQCLDIALNPLQFLVVSEDLHGTPLLELGSYCMAPLLLEYVGWGSEPREGEGHGGCYDNFVMVFNKGPIVMVRVELGVVSKGKLTFTELLCEYLRHEQLDQALDLLLCMNWEIYPQECCTTLTIFIDYILTLPLSTHNEELIETALGSFMSANHHIIEQDIKLEIDMLSRRFFFKLLHQKKFEKAFRLAVDLLAKDLFMDLHYKAIQYNETALAELSLKKAETVEYDRKLRNELKEEKKINIDNDEDDDVLARDFDVIDGDDVIDESHVISNPHTHTHNKRTSSESSMDSTSGIKMESIKYKTTLPESPKEYTEQDDVNIIDFGYFS